MKKIAILLLLLFLPTSPVLAQGSGLGEKSAAEILIGRWQLDIEGAVRNHPDNRGKTEAELRIPLEMARQAATTAQFNQVEFMADHILLRRDGASTPGGLYRVLRTDGRRVTLRIRKDEESPPRDEVWEIIDENHVRGVIDGDEAWLVRTKVAAGREEPPRTPQQMTWATDEPPTGEKALVGIWRLDVEGEIRHDPKKKDKPEAALQAEIRMAQAMSGPMIDMVVYEFTAGGRYFMRRAEFMVPLGTYEVVDVDGTKLTVVLDLIDEGRPIRTTLIVEGHRLRGHIDGDLRYLRRSVPQ